MRTAPRILLALAFLLGLAPAVRAAPPPKQVVVLVGLPGSGKSQIAQQLSQLTGAPTFSCGDVVRGWVRQQGLPYNKETDRQASQHFAAMPGEITRIVARQIDAAPQTMCIVDGVRRPSEMAMLKDQFDVRVVAVRAPARLRYPRMLARGRTEGESFDYYRARDRREIGLGVLHLLRKPFARLDGTLPLDKVPEQVRWLAAELARTYSSQSTAR
jgi:adenylate kinase family enzyme